jgi:hypothetical protein
LLRGRDGGVCPGREAGAASWQHSVRCLQASRSCLSWNVDGGSRFDSLVEKKKLTRDFGWPKRIRCSRSDSPERRIGSRR